MFAELPFCLILLRAANLWEAASPQLAGRDALQRIHQLGKWRFRTNVPGLDALGPDCPSRIRLESEEAFYHADGILWLPAGFTAFPSGKSSSGGSSGCFPPDGVVIGPGPGSALQPIAMTVNHQINALNASFKVSRSAGSRSVLIYSSTNFG